MFLGVLLIASFPVAQGSLILFSYSPADCSGPPSSSFHSAYHWSPGRDQPASPAACPRPLHLFAKPTSCDHTAYASPARPAEPDLPACSSWPVSCSTSLTPACLLILALCLLPASAHLGIHTGFAHWLSLLDLCLFQGV